MKSKNLVSTTSHFEHSQLQLDKLSKLSEHEIGFVSFTNEKLFVLRLSYELANLS